MSILYDNEKLYDAVTKDNLPEVQKQVSLGANINYQKHMRSLVNQASCDNHTDIALYLLDNGAYVNEDIHNSLLYASFNGNKILIEALLSKGADVRSTCAGGRHDNALLFPINPTENHPKQHNLEVAKLLLEAGVSVNQANEEGQTPLDLVRYSHDSDMIQLLCLYAGEAHNHASCISAL